MGYMGYNLALLLFLWVASMAGFEQLEAPFKLVFNQCLVDLVFLAIMPFMLPLKRQTFKKKRMKVGIV